MEKIHTMMVAPFAGMYDRDESEDRGAGFVEYGLLVGFIAFVALVGITAFGTDVSNFIGGLAGVL